MAAPIVAGLVYVLSVVAGWLLVHAGRLAISLFISWAIFESDFGFALIKRLFTELGPAEGMKEALGLYQTVPGNWTLWLGAANAWAPLAEMWTVIKIYYAFSISCFITKLTFKATGKK